MRTATFPTVRTTPQIREFVESVLRPGESLSTFIEETVHERARWRKEDEAFQARAMQASRQVDEGGPTISAEESMARLKAMLDQHQQALAVQHNGA